MSEFELDARRLLCPLPVIRTQDRIASLKTGDLLIVTCTDRGALHDIPAWCRVNGHRVVTIEEFDDEVKVTVEVLEQ
ncbi:MAG: sulfurtransferase TusA family protein [Gammaproteobacteria bacterium]